MIFGGESPSQAGILKFPATHKKRLPAGQAGSWRNFGHAALTELLKNLIVGDGLADHGQVIFSPNFSVTVRLSLMFWALYTTPIPPSTFPIFCNG
jgi:hypothetical protein